MVQATLASMRHYCPDVPICLVVDGDFDVSDLEKQYDLIVLRVPELPSQEMRKLICGDHRAKLAALWEGPFEFYVWLPHFYFDPVKLRRFDPDFEWRGNAYFSSGAFASRRKAIPFNVWDKVECWARQSSGLFAWGEMGMLNYLVHAMAQRKELKIVMSDLQHIGGHHGVDELKKDCADSNWRFPKTIRRPRVAHFCGGKPVLFDGNTYSRPFTIARLEHHRRHHSDLGAWVAVLNEDRRMLANKVKQRLRDLGAR